jgi:hypothetical protein
MEAKTPGFSADYEIRVVSVGADGSRTESRELFRLYRDTRGRMRLEGSTASGRGAPLRFAFLTDSQARHAVVVDLESGERLEPPHWPLLSALPTVGGPQAAASGVLLGQRTEDLGFGEIEGLTARGFRTTTALSVVDVWTALRIDQPPLLVRRKEPSREETQRLLNVRVGELDAELFEALEASR